MSIQTYDVKINDSNITYYTYYTIGKLRSILSYSIGGSFEANNILDNIYLGGISSANDYDTLKTLGIIGILVGAGAYYGSYEINEQLNAGRQKIQNAQKSIDQGKDLLSQTHVPNVLTKPFTGAAEKKISEGQEEINRYEKISSFLKNTGIILLLLGAAGVFFGFFNKAKK
ncbi:MAG: hypothetical protein EBZ47_06590 [Chlamydiae bacterium]|nr:hypothetical protein [Chlamydiota bacterium]